MCLVAQQISSIWLSLAYAAEFWCRTVFFVEFTYTPKLAERASPFVRSDKHLDTKQFAYQMSIRSECALIFFCLYVALSLLLLSSALLASTMRAHKPTHTHTHIQSIWIEMECHLCCLLQLIGLCRASIAIAPSVCAGIGTRKKTTSSEKCPFDGRIRFPIHIYRARTAKRKVRTVGYS